MICDQNWARLIGNRLATDIPARAGSVDDFKSWTRAVYEALKDIQTALGWHILPRDKCYAGEYLCDFMLFEPGYGCRLACESQWMHWGREHQASLNWAFDKLRGVKADVKLFVFEGSDEQWASVQGEYLRHYAQLSTREIFVALQWEKTRFKKWIWVPTNEGLQDRVDFIQF